MTAMAAKAAAAVATARKVDLIMWIPRLGLRGELSLIDPHLDLFIDFDEGDNDDCVVKPEDWTELSDEERQTKVKRFLKKLANVGRKCEKWQIW